MIGIYAIINKANNKMYINKMYIGESINVIICY